MGRFLFVEEVGEFSVFEALALQQVLAVLEYTILLGEFVLEIVQFFEG